VRRAKTEAVTESEVRESAIGLLVRRDHSRTELVRKLERRFGRDPERRELVASVVAALTEAGLQSDERRAEVLVHSAISRGQGPLKIRAALAQAGLGAFAAACLPSDDETWVAHLDALLHRRFDGVPPEDPREWSRRARFLAARGFPERLVRRQLGDPPPEPRID
jgi:regulatory protein